MLVAAKNSDGAYSPFERRIARTRIARLHVRWFVGGSEQELAVDFLLRFGQGSGGMASNQD